MPVFRPCSRTPFRRTLHTYRAKGFIPFLRLPEDEMEIPYEEFKTVFKKVRKEIYRLKDNDKLYHATHLKGEPDIVIRRGLENVGIFHLKRPLLKNRKGNIVTQDLNVLYYYHNRLAGYDLEKLI